MSRGDELMRLALRAGGADRHGTPLWAHLERRGLLDEAVAHLKASRAAGKRLDIHMVAQLEPGVSGLLPWEYSRFGWVIYGCGAFKDVELLQCWHGGPGAPHGTSLRISYQWDDDSDDLFAYEDGLRVFAVRSGVTCVITSDRR